MSGTDDFAPRAIRLPRAEPAGGEGGPVVPETSTIDAADAIAATPPEPRRGWPWGSIFVGALAAFLGVAFSAWAEQTITALLARSPALGWAALALAGIAALALAIMLGKVLRDILRERRVEHLRERAVALLAGGEAEDAKTLSRQLLALYAARPDSARGRAALADALPDLFAARDVLAVAERTLLEPLDARAEAAVAQAARRVSLVTAVSPRALIDVVFVLVACARMLRAIASIYAGRPGALGLLRLARQTLSHLVLTGGIAAGDAVIQQVVGQGLAARLSAKLGEGVLNGLLTARIGLAAIAVCRPLPFVESAPPRLSDIATGLGSG